ncbi:programmed cell death protein 1 [Neomonachus schauinslandi]|uniref:Programmed cell death protein 1 n=1 Tax=Neomonachus schauinslandi TaxID=29088 RepID=A0A2Y9G730_NEOSC|nr:programmed cell death protein 1 [Neomonachus schauinslandi]
MFWEKKIELHAKHLQNEAARTCSSALDSTAPQVSGHSRREYNCEQHHINSAYNHHLVTSLNLVLHMPSGPGSFWVSCPGVQAPGMGSGADSEKRTLEPPTESPSPPPRLTGQLQGLVIGITSVLVGVLFLLLLTWVLAAAFPRAAQGACACGSEEEPLKEGPSAAPVFTVDYGELDFQWREKTPEPPAPCAPEQTEYATIVFPSRPGSPGRRASANSPQGPQPLSPEDGPCRWPL